MGFQQGLSGLNAAAKNLDVIGNNIANANTVGYKSFRAEFADLFANSLAGAGSSAIGIGTVVADVTADFSQGNTVTTSNPLDLAINGGGFFRLSNNGTLNYSRNGQFQVDKDGHLVNASGGRLQGYPVDPAGGVIPAAPSDLRVSAADLQPKLTTEANAVLNLDSRKAPITAAFDVNDTTTYHNATSLSVYDSLGNPHTLTLYFVKTAPNTWDVQGASDGVRIGTTPLGTINFRNDGAIDTTATALPFSLSVPVASTGAASPLAMTLDFSGATQFGSAFGVNEISQDGYASGRLTGFNISADGTLLGRYSNGQSRAQGQIVLANFTNPQGLQHLGNNLLAETTESGQALVGAPGSGNLGVLQSGALEESNVDLTAELVNMITAQRVYQANAQSIRAEDAVLQTIVNLR